MNKYKKTLIIGYLVVNCFIMSSCFSYQDINKVIFITALVIDVDREGGIILYTEAFKGIRGLAPQGTDVRVLFQGEGKTMFEAVRNMNATSSYKLNYTQNKAVIFTQRAAELGLDTYKDFLDRDQELLLRPYVAVYLGDPVELLNLDITQEKYIGTFIVQLIENIGASSRAVVLSLNEFFNQRTMGDKSSVITIIDIPRDSLEAKLQVNGGAVVKDDRMIDRLTRAEGQGYNFLVNTIEGGTLEVTNPCNTEKFVTLEIKKSRTKTEISYDKNIVHLKKKVKVNVDFGEAQKSIVLSKENINKIQEKAESNIIEAMQEVFQKYKDMGVDIFDITEQFNAKYPRVMIKDIINKTELEVQADVEIMNTGDTRNFE